MAAQPDKDNIFGKEAHDVATRTAPDVDASVTIADLQLRAQGHVSELPRRFSRLSTLALAFSITNTWIGYSSTFVVPLLAGAGRAVFCCLILACVACTILATGLAELASAFPSAGGQYHFALMISPPQWRALVGFVTGWLSMLGWLFTTSSTIVFCSSTSVTLASFYHATYEPKQWHVYLIYLLITIVTCALICLLPKWVPAAENVFLFVSLIGFVVSFITVLATSNTKQPARVVFSDWRNQTGWPDGFAFLLATGQTMYGFLGLDAATHISEEMPNPGRNVPRILVSIMWIGSITSVLWTIAFMFSTNNLDAVASSPIPIYTVYIQATGSKDVATFFTVWITFIFYSALVSCFVTSGRLVWAFARDNGLPYSRIFAKVHPTLETPVNATILAGVFMSAVGALYIASTTAFNSIIALAILSSYLTCTIPQTILLVRGRKVLPRRAFDLGSWLGPFCNIFSTAYVGLYTVLFCFPLFLPVEVSSMNYVSVVFAGCLLCIAILWWGGKRRTFVGPVVEGLEVLGQLNVTSRGDDEQRVDWRKMSAQGLGMKSLKPQSAA